MKFCALASGSQGNAVWVEEGGLAILLDCGLPYREFKNRARLAGLDPGRLGCVLVSHEHTDHISGLGPLCRALKIPALANRATWESMAERVGRVTWETFSTGDTLSFGPFKIRTMPISHDTPDPVAFLIQSPSGDLGLATDMGAPTGLVRQKFQGLAALILEFNHDYRRLMEGPYPWPLKQRVRSRIGHLDNETAAGLAAELYHSDLRHLVLAHLSETNNSPELALQAAREALYDSIEPVVAGQWSPTRVFEL